MKRTLLFALLFLIAVTAFPQTKKRGRVKRKYSDVERVQEVLPPVIFRGLVRDADRNPIPGASVEIEGLRLMVHANEDGRFKLTGLPTGRLRIRVSCLGFLTKTIDFMFQEGFNDHYVTLDRSRISLEPVFATSQNREQHIPDIPASLFVLTRSLARQLLVTGYSPLSQLIPSLWFENSGPGNNGFIIHGSAGNTGNPGLSPGVAVFADQVPLSDPGGFSSEFFDIERMEILIGPQNTLFGREALQGAVHFVSRKPEDAFGGYVTAGAGSFGFREVEMAMNYPLIEEMLYVRAAGLYRDRIGYVDNASGGTLNGLNTLGGRFSVRFLPVMDHKIDLQLNYQKSDEPGIAFLNRWMAGEEGEDDLFDDRASLTRGEEPGSRQQLMDATLTYRFFRDDHNYWTSVSSYRKADHSGAVDTDGTSLPALETDYAAVSELFYQEIRYNFMRRSRLNGSAGISYFREKTGFSETLLSNDRHLFRILSDSANFMMPGESLFPIHPTPLNPDPVSSLTLTGDHREGIYQHKKTRSAQAFIHFTWQWRRRLFFTGGARAFYDRIGLFNDSVFTGGEASALGQFTGAAPNLLFSTAEMPEFTENSLSVTGQAGLAYRPGERFHLFLNAVRGRKPGVLHYSSDGQPKIAAAETVNSLEAGWKATVRKQIFWEVNGFYRQHTHVQTLQPYGTMGAGLISSDGKATSYGAETGWKAALFRGLELFGNYAWLRSAFDSTGVDGNAYPYAGNSFALAPEHSFSAGIRANVNISGNMRLFAVPWYSWKSHFWFTEANTHGLEQPAYGLLNVNYGIELLRPKVVLSTYVTNLLEQKYISSAGYRGGQLGMPVFIPGPPRMAGVRVTWDF